MLENNIDGMVEVLYAGRVIDLGGVEEAKRRLEAYWADKMVMVWTTDSIRAICKYFRIDEIPSNEDAIAIMGMAIEGDPEGISLTRSYIWAVAGAYFREKKHALSQEGELDWTL